MPIPVILAGATELIKLGISVFEKYNNGATQAEMDAAWADMQTKLRAANAAWEAAKRT